MRTILTSLILATACLAISGCKQQEVTSYRVPKEDRMAQARRQLAAMQGQGQMANASGNSSGSSEISWKAPKSWEEQPATAMRKGSFRVVGKAGASADMSIVTFPGDAGGDLANINRWRGQLQLSPIEAITKEIASTEKLPAGEFLVLNFTNAKGDQRMLAAILHTDSQTWFFKMLGENNLVLGEKANFYNFLKSVKFGAGSADVKVSGNNESSTPPPPGHESDTPPPALTWRLPAGWVQQPNSPMRVGSFSVTGKNGEKAEVSLIDMPGSAGGLSANIEMWRQQLELSNESDTEKDKSTTSLDIPLGKGSLVELQSDKPVLDGKSKARMLVAVIPHGDQTWFFKMVGSDSLVAAQKKTFLEFLNSLRPFEAK